MKERFLNATIATMLIITLTMVNFIVLGVNVVTYASELLHQTSETNYKNVEFTSYFKTQTGDKIDLAQTPINTEGLKLYMQVAVKEEGFFNGSIEVANSNFTVNQEKASKEINKITGNTITLNQINAGQKAEVEVGITPITEDVIDEGLLSAVTDVILTGTYVSSNNKETPIESTKNVQLSLQSPYTDNSGIKLTSEIITNKLFTVEEETKRMVQVKIRSGIEGNMYPIKSSNIKLSIPEGVENIEVSSQGTKATNGKTSFAYERVPNEENTSEILNITIENAPSEDGKISWEKTGEDIIVVTYIFPKDVEIATNEVEVNSQIKLYDLKETKLEANTKVEIAEEKDGTIEVEQLTSEKSIYKGKIYAKEERTLKTNTNIYINYPEQAQNIKIKETQATYEGKETLLANLQYKQTTINKEQMMNRLGEEGYIKIFNQNDEEILKLTNETTPNESGNFVIQYENGVKGISIETSKPIAKGTISIKHIKTLQPEEYTRDIIRNINTLKQELIATYNEQEIDTGVLTELKETVTQATLATSSNIISTQRETEIELVATLKANEESQDLYKNPTVKIQLPQETTSINVSNIDLLYEDELKVKTANYDKQNKTIIIELEGEQTKYHTDLSEGAQIYIALKVLADDLTPSKSSKIIFTYTNQNAIEQEKQAELPIKIESKYGLMLYSKMLNYNDAKEIAKTIDSQVAIAKIDTSKEAKIATVNLAVLNNYGTTISNVSIIGKIAKKDVMDSTFDTKLLQTVNTNLKGAKVYYSEEANADINSTTWVEEIAELSKVQSYKIELEKMEPEEVLKFAYQIEIPENLNYNQIANSSFTATYTYVEKEMSATSSIQMKTPEKRLIQYFKNEEQNAIAETSSIQRAETQGIETTTEVTTSGGSNKVTLKDGDSVYEGQTLHYKVTVKNNTGADLSDLKLTATQTNAKFYGQKKEDYIHRDPGEEGVPKTYTIYGELDATELVFNQDKLEAGKEKVFEYEVIIGNIEGEGTTQGAIKVEANNQESVNVNTSYNIKQAKIKVITTVTSEEELYKTGNSILPVYAKVENLSNETLTNITVELPIPQDEYISFEKTSYYDSNFYDENLELVEDNNKVVKFNYKGEIKPGENKVFETVFTIGNFSEAEKLIQIYSLITVNGETYSSNVYSTTYARDLTSIEGSNLKIKQTSNPENGAKLIDKQEVTYILDVENIGPIIVDGNITFNVPNGIKVKKIYTIYGNNQKDITDEYVKKPEPEIVTDENGEQFIKYPTNITSRLIVLPLINKDGKEWLMPKEVIKVKIVTQFDIEYLEKIKNGEEITNTFKVTDDASGKSIQSNTITFYSSDIDETLYQPNNITEPDSEDDGNNGSNNNSNENNNGVDNNNTQTGTKYYKVTGTVWIDEDKNGKQDDATVTLDNIEIRAIDNKGEFVKDSKGNIISTKVSENGTYNISLPEGKCIIVFIYDTGKYKLTKYSEEEDASKVVDKTITIDGNKTKVAVTNLLNLNKDIENINMGLVERENFTLSLQKYISKVTVQNKEGTKIKEYKNNQFAKTEIRAKHFSGSTLLVEYKIDITNNGDVDGYVNDVIDYIPEGYKFSSSLNKTWFTSTDKNLHNNSLANEKIKAGETKTLTLVLTKTLTENDTGLIVNTAEIANSSSVSGSQDVNSTVNNNAKDEDDISSANLLVSVSTGAKTACIIGIIISFILVALCIYMIKREEV